MPDGIARSSGPDTQALNDFYAKDYAEANQGLADLTKQEQASTPQFTEKPPERQPGITGVAPWLIGLAALGGKAIGLHATTMLGATNGMVQGLIQGNEQKYKDQKTAYDEAYQKYREKFDQQNKLFNEMRQVYKGRVDADFKALQFARLVTNDGTHTRQGDEKHFLEVQKYDEGVRKHDMDDAYHQGELHLKQEKQAQALKDQGVSLTPDAIHLAAQRLANGEKQQDVLSNLGRGKQGAANITAVMNEFTRIAEDPATKLSAEDIADKKQTLAAEAKARQVEGGIAGKIRYAEEEIKRIAPKVLELSAQLPRGNFVSWNRLQQASEAQLSDPKLKQFKSYMTTLSNSYDVLAARGGTDMEKRKHNREMFDTADSPEALKAAVDAVTTEATISGEAADASMRRREPAAPQKQVTRTGIEAGTGRTVNQYSDGSTGYADVK
jgi:hypothetical protein